MDSEITDAKQHNQCFRVYEIRKSLRQYNAYFRAERRPESVKEQYRQMIAKADEDMQESE